MQTNETYVTRGEEQVIGAEYKVNPICLNSMRTIPLTIEMTRINDIARLHLHLIDVSTNKVVIKEEWQETFEKWILTGFYHRAWIVTRNPKFRVFRNTKDSAVKTLVTLAQLWSYIGEATDQLHRLHFVPVFKEPEPGDLLTEEEYHCFTRELERFPRAITLGVFPSRIQTGDADFMAMVWFEEALKAYHSVRQEYAFAASVVRKTTEDEWYRDHALITYTDESEYQAEVTLDMLMRIFHGSVAQKRVGTQNVEQGTD